MDIRKIVVDYIKTLDANDKKKMKVMLSHGVLCGKGFASERGVDLISFNNELKTILGGNE